MPTFASLHLAGGTNLQWLLAVGGWPTVALPPGSLVLTTFRFGRKRISRKNWRTLHKSGIYFL